MRPGIADLLTSAPNPDPGPKGASWPHAYGDDSALEPGPADGPAL